MLTEMLEPGFAQDHPVTFIPSYEGLAVAPAVPGAPPFELPPLPRASSCAKLGLSAQRRAAG